MNKTPLSLWEWLIAILLIVRPSLDIFTNSTITLGPISLNPAGALSLFLIALALLWLYSLNNQDRSRLFHPTLIRLYCLWLLLLIPWAMLPLWTLEHNTLTGIREWIRLLSYLPILLLATSLILKNQKSLFVWILALGFIIPALTGIFQIITQQGMLVRGVHRVSGTFVHPNPFAFYLVLMAAVAYTLWRLRLNHLPRIVWLLISIGLLISTYSFTGAIMFAVLIFFCAIGENRTFRIWALSTIILFTTIFCMTPAGWQRIKEVSQIDQLDEIERTGKETSSLTWRLLNWRYLYREWQKQPLFGYGLATSEYINPNYNIYEETGHQPHNDYVRFLVETGIVGLAIFLAILAMIAVCIRHAYLASSHQRARFIVWIMVSLYITWLVGSFADNVITATAYQYCLWYVLAGGCMIHILENAESHTPSLQG